jgi:hypothetical protein
MMLASTASALTGSSIPDRRLILRRNKSVPPPNMMDQDIGSVINRGFFHQQAPAHIRIMNSRSKAQGMITALNDQNLTAEVALRYRDIIVTIARTLHHRVLDVQ